MGTAHRLLLRADRKRQIPPRFSWLDQQLVRGGHLRTFSGCSAQLYLFLNTVGDLNGVSWYSDSRICLEAALSAAELAVAREELVAGDYLAYDGTVYQLLSLPQHCQGRSQRAASQPAMPPARPRRRPTGEEAAQVRATLGLPPLQR